MMTAITSFCFIVEGLGGTVPRGESRVMWVVVGTARVVAGAWLRSREGAWAVKLGAWSWNAPGGV